MIESGPPGTCLPGERRSLWVSIALGTALSLSVCCAMAAHAVTVGARAGGWFYPYGQRPSVLLLACWLMYAGAAAALVSLPWRLTERRPWWTVIAWMVIATVLQWIVRSLASYPLEAVFVSDNANSFYSVATEHGPGEVLEKFNRIRLNAPLHVQSNMPGKLLLLSVLQLFSTRTDVLPWLVIGVSNLGALLMFAFVRDLFDSRRVALAAAALYLFLPGRMFFFPLMNTVTPLAVLACAWLLLAWLRTSRTVYAVLLGFALYGFVIFEPLPLVIGLLFLALVVAAVLRREMPWDLFIAQAGLSIVAFIVASEVVEAWSGFDIVYAFHAVSQHAIEFNETNARPYGVWIVANLWEFAFGSGFCQAVVLAGALAAALRPPGNWRERLSRPIAALCVGLVAVLGAVDLLGVNRGEVTRLWIFLGCFFQIPAAWACSMLASRVAIALVVGVTALHAAVGVTLINFVVP